MKISSLIFFWLGTVSNLPLAMAQTVDQFFVVYDLVRARVQNNRGFARSLVRMAFDDAMGGVDANIDLSSSEHKGLEGTFNALNQTWNDNQASLTGLSKADFFAWAYIAAFYTTCENHVPWVPLRVGRTTFTSAQVEDTPPGSSAGSGDFDAVMSYFASTFGFNETEAAIIMGAHTLGGAHIENTGFVGDWTRSPNTFNNGFYENLVNPPGRGGWEQIEVSSGKFEWRWGCDNRCRDMMLNVDINLFYELDNYYVGDSGQVRLPDPLPTTAPSGLCNNPDRVFADCFPQRTGSETHSIISRYDNGNNNEFLDVFAMVYGDLVSRVKDGASLIEIGGPPADWPAGIDTLGGQGGGNISGSPPNGGGGPPPSSGTGDNNGGGNNVGSGGNNGGSLNGSGNGGIPPPPPPPAGNGGSGGSGGGGAGSGGGGSGGGGIGGGGGSGGGGVPFGGNGGAGPPPGGNFRGFNPNNGPSGGTGGFGP